MQKKIAVILSGCGYLDGSEITEATSALIALSAQGVDYKIFAPKVTLKPTSHVDESLLEPAPRNTLEESARIARGNIQDIADLNPKLFDGIVFPGGYGVAKNLCSWAQDGSKCSVHPKVKETIEAFYESSKPILAICIAPALIARVLGQITPVNLTIGNDKATAAEIQKTGCEHVECTVDDFVTDREAKVISTPAYMYEAKPHQVFTGIQKAVAEFVEMA
ncbi:MAG: isoprenoid biosynthesis glyoxalase ElbB [Bdellovibrionaceae bacterium]|nr:isoprenoid biosynthesis glyoxalase ElbB [Pseudobdellovibrionaceae bacterium]